MIESGDKISAAGPVSVGECPAMRNPNPDHVRPGQFHRGRGIASRDPGCRPKSRCGMRYFQAEPLSGSRPIDAAALLNGVTRLLPVLADTMSSDTVVVLATPTAREVKRSRELRAFGERSEANRSYIIGDKQM